MKHLMRTSAIALVMTTATAAVHAQEVDDSPEAAQRGLDVITITSQRRETTVQDAGLAVTAVSGDNLEQDRIMSFEDLADSVTSMSFTALSPLDQEFNIRGITNTRLDSPSADQSVGIFVDDVYVGRSGLFNFDMYDIDRVEVIRGPQGVLLGRNVVGGAIRIITARPSFEEGGSMAVSIGNYDSVVARGHVTGQIGDSDFAGRLAFQTHRHAGYNQDILHGRDLDDLRSIQGRAQLLYQPDDSPLTARFVLDYTDDESNGFHSVAINGPDPATQGPWSAAREAIGQIRGAPLDIRESLPEHPRYAGDANETAQGLRREAWGALLDIDYDFADFATFTSVTGWRQGQAFNLYDQTGIGPDNGYGVLTPTLFSFPVNEREEIKQFSQEVRLVSNTDGPFDWIVGGYYQTDEVNKFDRFWAEVPLPVLVTLSGESHWDNFAETTSYAAFAQLGYRFNEQFRIVGGIRYTNDEKSGTVTGRAVEGGDQFNPTDQVALTPLAATYLEGQSFTTDYGRDWSEVTPQITAEYTPNEDFLLYATWSRGYKGGGFEDDPANPAAAQAGYDPETVENIEIGAKLDFAGNRARLNVAAFSMDYQDLQVTQTDDGCLCNITDNAADAEIQGVEAEFQFAPVDRLLLWGGATLLNTEYVDFVDSTGLDASGNQLQRTPESQFNVGAELTLDAFGWSDALSLRANYSWQGEMYWAPDNAQTEDAYGLLNGRISLAPANTNWRISAWGRNLTDEIYRTNIIAFFGDEVSRLGTPRTYGVEIAVDF